MKPCHTQRALTIATAILLATSAAAQRPSQAPPPPAPAATLQGKWQCVVEDESIALNILADRLQFGSEEMRYRVAANRVWVEQNGVARPHQYALNGDRLEIVSPEGIYIACTRAGERATGRPGSASEAASASSYNGLLVGVVCGFAGTSNTSGSTSRITRVQFDGRGEFVVATEGTFSGSAGLGWSNSGAQRGSYTVTAPRIGAAIRVRWQNGDQETAYVTQLSGNRIAEFQYGKQVYSAGLCNF
jgi:hypothetical protein